MQCVVAVWLNNKQLIIGMKKNEPDDFMNKYNDKNNEMKSHVQKVLISDSLDLLTIYSSFAKGAVDLDAFCQTHLINNARKEFK